MAVPRIVRALIPVGLVQVAAVTPVQKVTDLLERLAKVIEEEGKEEATAYDKYACFCKEESDDKLYAIERSTKIEAKLGATISKLGTEITGLDGDIQGLGTQILNLTGMVTTEEGTRATAHGTFVTNQEAAQAAISAVQRAIEALEESKDALGGKAELDASSLAQIRAVVQMGVAAGIPEALVQLRALPSSPDEVYTYKYRSNDIISTLQTLLGTFKGRLADLEQTEFDQRTASEKKVLGLSKEKKFTEQDKAEKEEIREAKQEEKEEAEAAKTQEQTERQADENFQRVLTQDCEAKAGFWDQRSSTRSSELTAIGSAVDALKEGVAPNWKANKKLVGLQTKAAPSFLQSGSKSLRGSGGNAARVAAIAKVQQALAAAATSQNSPLLSLAALKVLSAEDHFVKVRQIIVDLMDKLEADQTAEQSHKTWCDTQIAAAISSRDTAQSEVEKHMANIASKKAQIAQLKGEIAELSRQIAENKKALAEATELRNEESADNNRTQTDAQAGKASVDNAIQVLNTFYSNAFVQYAPWKATDSDRDGKTVGDKAPEVFDSNYHGSQDASKGIIGILEVISSDFERTDTTTAAAELAAAGIYDLFKIANEADTLTKDGQVTTKGLQINTLKLGLTTAVDDLDTEEGNHKSALEELSDLHSQCIAGEETYEERVEARNREIEALKEANNILENWS